MCCPNSDLGLGLGLGLGFSLGSGFGFWLLFFSKYNTTPNIGCQKTGPGVPTLPQGTPVVLGGPWDLVTTYNWGNPCKPI